jgi:hypothetical protein
MNTLTRKALLRSRQVASFAFAIGLSFAMLTPVAIAENFGTQLGDAFKDGEFDVDFRYRYEYVDRESRGPADPVVKNANASTLRSRLVFKTGDFYNTFLTLGMDDVRTIVSDNYNSTRNGNSRYPVVADPTGTDINLASITFTGLKNAPIVLGRQRIIRDNSRYVGNVGWRQNEQTYDSISIDYKLEDKFEAFYSYVDRVKRIFGPQATLAPTKPVTFDSWSSNSHLIDASYTFLPLLKLSAYAYLLDFDNAPAFSSETFGARLTGKQDFGGNMGVSYRAEYAKQQDYKNNPNSYDEGYYHLNAGLDWSMLGLKLGYEVLEGAGAASQTSAAATGVAFQTPLATLHKHNGWADQFLITPGAGLKDLYIQGTAKVLGGKIALVYHDFSAQTGGSDYGTEWDLKGSWKFWKYYSVLAGFAVYNADSNSPLRTAPDVQSDITKVWLMLNASF